MKPMYITSFVDASPADLASVPWGTFTEARQECFMAEKTMTYTYGSGRGVRTYTSIPYLPWVEEIRQILNEAGPRYNVCFLNRYEDAGQHLGWHADDSPGMDHEHPIAVISFGQAREIWWKPTEQTGVVPPEQRQLLEHGSMFVMPPGFQRTHQHRIPKGDRKMEPRASLTFRHYVEEKTP
jgi:alkylated DNA repair dioxygenase AlkB